MRSFLLARLRSFGYAFSGLWYMIRTQQNAWIHALATVCVAVLALWLGLTGRDWVALALTVGLVWMAEAFNTALEAAVDLVTPDKHPLAKAAKDAGAAAALIAAIAAFVVGCIIFGPPLWQRICEFFY